MPPETIQLAISDGRLASRIERILASTGEWNIEHLVHPNPGQTNSVIVSDAARRSCSCVFMSNLDFLGSPIARPERVVLVIPNDPELIDRAWNEGLRAVIYDTEPPSTVVLAIMAAWLRVHGGSQGPGWPAVLDPH